MYKEFKKILQIILITIDLIFLNVALFIAFFLNQSKITDNKLTIQYFILWFVVNILWVCIAFINSAYFEKSIIHFETYTKKSIHSYLLWMTCILLFITFIYPVLVSTKTFLILFILWGIFLMINRFIYIGIHKYNKHNNHIYKNVLILGYNSLSRKLASYIDQEYVNINLKGFVEDIKNIKELSPYPIYSDRKDILTIATQLSVEEIFSTLEPDQNKFITELIQNADKRCIRIKIIPDLSYFISKPITVNYLRDLPILSPRSEPLEDITNRVKKRVFDLVFSFLVIVFILSWLIPLVGLLIIIESKGPVFFVQERTGKNNRSFKCLKFRSMRINGTSDLQQAKKNDERITRLGKFLRKSSLDEFPQFINVFNGEMSLVGPRPHMLKHTDEYSKIVNQFMIRHFSKPGITGWAQINGFRGEITDTEQIRLRVENDIWYLEHWTIWLDIKIIFLTIYKVFKGDKKAY